MPVGLFDVSFANTESVNVSSAGPRQLTVVLESILEPFLIVYVAWEPDRSEMLMHQVPWSVPLSRSTSG